MPDKLLDNRRVVKNTFYLYIRMFLMMAITLYTSRVVLATLGIIDFGIYNTVAAIVAMMGFLNSSMSNAVQRFLSYEMGYGDSKKICDIFNAALRVHAIIALIVLVLMELVGLWLLDGRLNIPCDRIQAAQCVFHCSVVMMVFSIIQVPYNSMIISKEDMNVYAFVSIIEVLFKLGVVYFLILCNSDKLQLYAILTMVVTIFITICYILYCIWHYIEVRISRINTYKNIKDLMTFAGWNIFGELSWIFTIQGVTLLLNVFWGPVVNAARAIALQVDTAVSRFVINFQAALNPQIIKNYAAHHIHDTLKLFYRGTRVSYYLLLILSLPILFETNYLLALWLEDVPPLTDSFCKIAIITSLVQCVSNLFATIAKAYGQIRNYQLVVSMLIGLNFPMAYLIIWLGGNVLLVVSTTIFVQLCVLVARILLTKRMINYSICDFIKNVIFPILSVTIVSCIVPYSICMCYKEGLYRCLLNLVITVISTLVVIWSIGLKRAERQFVLQSIKVKIALLNNEK